MPPPVVTGISPMKGPPGTQVTIRGEFLGKSPTDLVGLIICGCDCLLSAEWKSPNKIIARTGPGEGSGDIIVTTLSGGKGSCTVQFRGYHETIGPLKESAVWVEEAPVQNLGWGSQASTTSIQIEDPLGLSVEENEKKFPEPDLVKDFPGHNGDLASEQFSPAWYLLEHHHATSFDDLRAGLAYLKRKVGTQKEGQVSFLKGNVGSVMEQLETLENLKVAVEKDVNEFGLNRTQKIQEALEGCMNEANMLFEGVLKGREKADRTRNALGVLQRFKFLFTLPASIQRNMERAEYDTIINDYARVTNLFGKTDVNLFKKVLGEVKIKITELKAVLRERLKVMPNTLENQKKLIRNLVQLECEGDPGWEAITIHSQFINDQINECHTYHLTAESTEESNSKSNKGIMRHKRNLSGTQDLQYGLGHRIECVEDVVDIISLRLPDMWALGQSYFNGELHLKPDMTKQNEFKQLFVWEISTMCKLIRSSLMMTPSQTASPQRLASLAPWLPHCLRHIRIAYASLIALDIPQEALEVLGSLIHDLRFQCVRTALKSAADQVKTLKAKETWTLENDKKYGTITTLPKQFEAILTECFSSLKESVLQKGNRETNLFSTSQAKDEVGGLIRSSFISFNQCLEQLAFNSEDGELSTASIPTSSGPLTWEERVLACISNCRYMECVVLPSVLDCSVSHGLPDFHSAAINIKDVMSQLETTLIFAYTENKFDPLVGTIEPSMYVGHFDWDMDRPPHDVRPYAKEIIANVIAVISECEGVSSSLRDRLITNLVDTVAEEVSRLLLCAGKMSTYGTQQARLDVLALQFTFRHFTSNQANAFFKEALEAIPQLNMADEKEVDVLLEKFKGRMAIQLSCFEGYRRRTS